MHRGPPLWPGYQSTPHISTTEVSDFMSVPQQPRHDTLFEPTSIGDVALGNRVALAPMSRVSAYPHLPRQGLRQPSSVGWRRGRRGRHLHRAVRHRHRLHPHHRIPCSGTGFRRRRPNAGQACQTIQRAIGHRQRPPGRTPRRRHPHRLRHRRCRRPGQTRAGQPGLATPRANGPTTRPRPARRPARARRDRQRLGARRDPHRFSPGAFRKPLRRCLNASRDAQRP
ncbi:Mycobacterium numidiamassiliense ORFan [Mycobacterium numidiamassiliense]|uniref:Mycobacterium numidiamassiliense ORFan n=1 Tax=Mycobacterium numidiamassiliense TaxID=1841861 RepID=A0A2U3P3A0_9MYCO|nr:Mycobacterium numidiamassiliense ORFan [Mycobacterium numidiamassiliense]